MRWNLENLKHQHHHHHHNPLNYETQIKESNKDTVRDTYGFLQGKVN